MAASAPLIPVPAGNRVQSRRRPMVDGDPCGDATRSYVLAKPGHHLLAVIDGLGHGIEAARAADAALRLIGSDPAADLPDLFKRLDDGLKATRGAAIGLVHVAGARLRHAAVGNTRALRWRGDTVTRLPSQPGVVGAGSGPHIAVNELDLQDGDSLLLFTDGIDERLQLPVRLPEWQRDPGLLCEHIVRHWGAARDDAAVLVMHIGAA